ncbi:MAG: DUF501 domain-containing protein [Bacillota bacterium]
MEVKYRELDEGNLNIIKRQLEREPDNVMGVARFCPHSKPMVIVTFPFSREKGVFPTTFWLSCPFWVKEVSRLEDKGMVKEITDKVNNNKDLKQKLKIAHEKYADKRMTLLGEDIKKEISNISTDIMDVLQNSGIAGIRNREGVKCLHAHLADYLVNNFNPVGKIVHEELSPLTLCDENMKGI